MIFKVPLLNLARFPIGNTVPKFPIALLIAHRNFNILKSIRIAQRPRQVGVASFHMSPSNLSTKTSPPPPPPPHKNKNSKGQAMLSRITRAFTFSFSTVLVLGALGISSLVLFLIFSELFLPSGDTRAFNKIVKLVEDSPEAQRLLNFKEGDRLKAYADTPVGKWTRNRPIQSVRMRGQDGMDHHVMKFRVESDKGLYGTVSSEQVDETFWKSEFAYIALDVPGNKRAYIIKPKFLPKEYVPNVGNSGFLGLKWGPKKDD